MAIQRDNLSVLKMVHEMSHCESDDERLEVLRKWIDKPTEEVILDISYTVWITWVQMCSMARTDPCLQLGELDGLYDSLDKADKSLWN